MLCVSEQPFEKELRNLDEAEGALSERKSAARHAGDAAELHAIADGQGQVGKRRDEIAQALDEIALGRDTRALNRDVRASARDRASRRPAEEFDAGFPDRYLSGTDRDFSAGDRADRLQDRNRSSAARDLAATDRAQAAATEEQLYEALETRDLIGQAKGKLMQR